MDAKEDVIIGDFSSPNSYTRKQLSFLLVDCLRDLSFISNEVETTAFGDAGIVDVCNCYFKFGNRWLIAWVRQYFGLSRYYFECEITQHNPGGKTRCSDTKHWSIVLAKSLSEKTSKNWSVLGE